MAEPLTGRFGVTDDVVALVGAGGKTTIAFGLAEEAKEKGRRVVLTTTTKLGADQTGGLAVVRPDVNRVAAALDASGACLVISARAGHKATGVTPEFVDALWTSGVADLIVVEADGARRRKIKAPAPYEPVVPACATLVIAVTAASAMGRVIADVAHRPELVAALLDVPVSDRLTPRHVAAVMGSKAGGRKSVPDGARFIVAVTGADGEHRAPAVEVVSLLDPVPVVLL